MKRQATSRAGRRHKGEREVMTTRLPKPLAEAVRLRAEENDTSFSDEIANAVAASFGLAPVVPVTPRQQDPLDLPA